MKLNKTERIKKNLAPYDFYTMIGQIDLHALNEEERFYLKNYGIYNIKLEPERFMIRLRIAGGRIERERLRFVANIARSYNAELLLTARAQLEIHALNAANVLEVWQLLHDAGFTTLQTLTDNFRNIVCDPYDGEDIDAKVEVYPLIEKMQSYFLGQPEWMGMIPRKFNTAICGTASTHTHFFGNDLYFALASKGNRWGFNLYLGGKNAEAAQDADIFVEPKRVPELFLAVAKAYRHYGLRGTRSKTRLYHLIADIGMAAFVAHIREFYPYTLEKRGETAIQKAKVTAYRELKNGRYGYCVQSEFGKIDTASLLQIITYADEADLEIRVGVDQNLYLLGLAEPTMPFGKTLGASHVTACAGSSYCALSLWDIKSDTRYLPLALIEKYQVQIGFSGCLKGCGRHHHADIGLVGLRTNTYGETRKAARVFLGGEYSSGGRVARLIFPVVPIEELRQVLSVVIDSFVQSGLDDFEQFSREYLNPLSTDFLLLWFLAKLSFGFDIPLQKLPERALYSLLRQVEGFPDIDEDEKYSRTISTLMHRLWDD